MSDRPSTPGGARGDRLLPTHTTYEFAIPVRDVSTDGPAHQQRDAAPPAQEDTATSTRTTPAHTNKSTHTHSQSSSPAPSPMSTSDSSSSPLRDPSPSSPKPPSNKSSGIQIPKIKPFGSGPSPAELSAGLVGKYVDEFGNILDWDGTVMGRVNGDLPSMVGRPVNQTGEIIDTDGEVAGHVSENFIKPALKPATNLKTDDQGNIYDDQGNIVGKLHGASAPRNELVRTTSNDKKRKHDGEHHHGDEEERSSSRQRCSCGAPRGQPPSAPRPDEMYLDVKSTFDGIQLIIKIPTVFNGGGNVGNNAGTNNNGNDTDGNQDNRNQ